MEPTRLPEPLHVTIGGATITTYRLLPEASSKGDVVLCHGTPWSAQVWEEVARNLSAGYRVFLWDMPGYGRSSKDVPVDLPAQMARFAALLSHWGLDRPHVVAHDIGGAVALGAHLLPGAEYADLFVWDIVTLDPWGSPFFRLVAEHSEVFAQLPAALHRALVKEYIAGAARHRLTPAWVDAFTRPWLGTTGQSAFYRQIAALRTEHTRPVADQLADVRCPVRIGWGAEDPWLPADQAHQLQALLPGTATVLKLDDVGHLAPVEEPSAVTQAISDWLARDRSAD